MSDGTEVHAPAARAARATSDTEKRSIGFSSTGRIEVYQGSMCFACVRREKRGRMRRSEPARRESAEAPLE
jgi:hypothetical protein